MLNCFNLALTEQSVINWFILLKPSHFLKTKVTYLKDIEAGIFKKKLLPQYFLEDLNLLLNFWWSRAVFSNFFVLRTPWQRKKVKVVSMYPLIKLRRCPSNMFWRIEVTHFTIFFSLLLNLIFTCLQCSLYCMSPWPVFPHSHLKSCSIGWKFHLSFRQSCSSNVFLRDAPQQWWYKAWKQRVAISVNWSRLNLNSFLCKRNIERGIWTANLPYLW